MGTSRKRSFRPGGEKGTAVSAEEAFGYQGYEFTSHPRFTYRRIREMIRTDGTMRGLDVAIRLTLRSVTPTVEPGGDDGEGEREAEFVRSVLLDAPQDGGMTTKIADVQAHMAMASRYGIEFMEKVWWQIPNGKFKGMYGFKKLAHRPITGCKVMPDRNGTFNGFKQEDYRPDGSRVNIHFPPPLAFVYIRGQEESMLEGASALEAAYHHWLDKKDGIKLWKENMATFAMGMLVGKYPRGMGKEKRDRFLDMITNIRGAGRAAISQDEELDILRSSSVGEFREFMDYMDAQATISALGQGLRIGQSNNPLGIGGGQVAETHQDLFLLSCDSELQMQGEALTEYVAAPLVMENFGDDPTFPVVKFPKLQDQARQMALQIWTEFVRTRGLEVPLQDMIQQLALEGMGVDEKTLKKMEKERDNAPAPAQNGDGNGQVNDDGFLQRARQEVQRIRSGGTGG